MHGSRIDGVLQGVRRKPQGVPSYMRRRRQKAGFAVQSLPNPTVEVAVQSCDGTWTGRLPEFLPKFTTGLQTRR